MHKRYSDLSAQRRLLLALETHRVLMLPAASRLAPIAHSLHLRALATRKKGEAGRTILKITPRGIDVARKIRKELNNAD